MISHGEMIWIDMNWYDPRIPVILWSSSACRPCGAVAPTRRCATLTMRGFLLVTRKDIEIGKIWDKPTKIGNIYEYLLFYIFFAITTFMDIYIYIYILVPWASHVLMWNAVGPPSCLETLSIPLHTVHFSMKDRIIIGHIFPQIHIRFSQQNRWRCQPCFFQSTI